GNDGRARTGSTQSNEPAVIIEMRTYRAKPGKRDEFLRIFRSKMIPAHVESGMKILGPFVSIDDADTFFFRRGWRHSLGAARGRNLSRLRTTYTARITSPSISNAAVCTAPSGASTTTPGRPLIVAKRSLKSWRHHAPGRLRAASITNCATRSAPSITA